MSAKVSSTQQILSKYLLCSRHCTGCWAYRQVTSLWSLSGIARDGQISMLTRKYWVGTSTMMKIKPDNTEEGTHLREKNNSVWVFWGWKLWLCGTFGTSRVEMSRALFGSREILAGDSDNKTAESWYHKAGGWHTDGSENTSQLLFLQAVWPQRLHSPSSPLAPSPFSHGASLPCPYLGVSAVPVPSPTCPLGFIQSWAQTSPPGRGRAQQPFFALLCLSSDILFFVRCLFHERQLYESRDLVLSISLPPVPRKLTCSRSSAYEWTCKGKMNVAYCLVGETIINQKITQINVKLQWCWVVRHSGNTERTLTYPWGRWSGALTWGRRPGCSRSMLGPHCLPWSAWAEQGLAASSSCWNPVSYLVTGTIIAFVGISLAGKWLLTSLRNKFF